MDLTQTIQKMPYPIVLYDIFDLFMAWLKRIYEGNIGGWGQINLLKIVEFRDKIEQTLAYS